MPRIFQGPLHFAFAVDVGGVRSKKQKEEQFKKCKISITKRPKIMSVLQIDHLKP
jgi:hypothetical protein